MTDDPASPRSRARPTNLVLESHNAFYDHRIHNGAWKTSPKADDIMKFFLHLSICHTVIPQPLVGSESDPESWRGDNLRYQVLWC